MLSEKFVANIDQPEKLIWANGTTDKRFDLGKNKFRSIANPNEEAKFSPFSPMYLTSNISYAFAYMKSHIAKDYKKPKTEYGLDVFGYKNRYAFQKDYNNGIFVFAELSQGTELFDFTDASDYAKVFSKDANEIFKIFKDVEPFFAFSTIVPNYAKKYIPIEFNIALQYATFHVPV